LCKEPAGTLASGLSSIKKVEKIYDLEDRLVNYTCRMIDVVEALPKSRSGNYMAGQLIRCCHSPALNYSESQSAESPPDFIHKLRVVLKELKECRTCMKIIIRKEYIQPVTKLDPLFQETEELIAIVGKSIATSLYNKKFTS
jgi:four helix bundle protein